MEVNKVLMVLLSLFLGMNALAQEVDSICWNKDVKLKWSDFKGAPDWNSEWFAVCPAAIKAEGFWDNGLPNFDVTNCFDKVSAWTKDTTSLSGLEHEQLHFDIAEVHARKIRKAIDSLREEGEVGFEPYSFIVRCLLSKRNKVDSLYDYETAHGLNEAQQEEWKKKIWEELESLDEYSYDD